MKIVEQSATKLAFKIGMPYFNGSECAFDRNTGRATIKRWVLLWPRRTIDLALGDIAGAKLGVASVSGQGGEQFYPIVVLKSGKQVTLPTFSETAARRAVDAITAFLAPSDPAAAAGRDPG